MVGKHITRIYGALCGAAIAVAGLAFGAVVVAQAPQAGFGVAGGQSSRAADMRAPMAQAAGQGCPIAMYARHGGGGLVLNAGGKAGGKAGGEAGERPERSAGPAQHIHLELGKAGDVADVAGVKVMVRGTGGRNRTIATGAAGDAAGDPGAAGGMVSDASRSFDLAVKISGEKTAATDLILNGFTSVQSITLQSVMFADGTVWTAGHGQSCRIAPDPLMLIGR